MRAMLVILQSAFYVCFSEDLRRGKCVSLAWRRELKSSYDNWRNIGERCCRSGVSLFLDREFKLQAQNSQRVIFYLL